jgi:hypothetical protein
MNDFQGRKNTKKEKEHQTEERIVFFTYFFCFHLSLIKIYKPLLTKIF